MVKALLSVFFMSALALSAGAAWYWPFSDGEAEGKPRLSELLEKASLLIDDASDCAADGDITAAVGKYREALDEIARVESENAGLVETPEYNSLRNKRAYVTAAIDSLLLAQAQDNARPVAVTDTTELQRRYDEKHGRVSVGPVEDGSVGEPVREPAEAEAAAVPPPAAPDHPLTRAEKLSLAVRDLKARDFDAVLLLVGELLDETPKDAAAMNLRAAAEIGRGEYRVAEKTLDETIQSNPRSYYAYYNMARLMLEHGVGSRDAARRYYATGREIGGPVNATLEGALK